MLRVSVHILASQPRHFKIELHDQITLAPSKVLQATGECLPSVAISDSATISNSEVFLAVHTQVLHVL